MTTVTLEKTGSAYTGHWYTVEAVGHATGSQDVCRTVSVLMQLLETWLLWKGATVSEDRVGSGDSRIRFTGKGSGIAFEMMYCGFRKLAETNPEYIQVNTKFH